MSTSHRILIGVGILAVLAVVDLIRKGRNATRWREYAFLLLCVATAMLYGMVNDQITSRISWEYFYYGKELAPIIGPDIPPNPTALSWQAARIGAEATWSAGLIAGVAMLIANNPSRRRPRLSYPRLMTRLSAIIGITLISAAIFGFAGDHGLLNWISIDFRDMSTLNLWRPRHFMTVYGIHLGGYVGGLAGLVFAVFGILSERNRGCTAEIAENAQNTR